MRVVLIGESPSLPSGFGMQMGLLARGLRDLGNEVFVLANNPPAFSEERLECWHIRGLDNPAIIDRELAKVKPDIAVVFYHTQQCLDMCKLKYTPRNIPVMFWLPWEGSKLPWNGFDYFNSVPVNRVIHLSRFAQELWSKQAPSKWVVPHMLADSCFVGRTFDVPALRRKWAKRLHIPLQSDTLLVLNCDRNIWHKRWDATFAYLKGLKASLPDRDVQMIAHTVTHQRGPNGVEGYNLEKVAELYGIREDVTFTDFDWAKGLDHVDVGELMAICDVRISTSQGEGFGVPTIECAALGKLQILNNTTTMPELLGDAENLMLVPPAFEEERLATIWQVPNVREMLKRTKYLLNNPEAADVAIKQAQEHVISKFNQNTVCDQFNEVLFETVTEESREKCWVTNRWGYAPSRFFEASMSSLPELLKRLSPDPRILDVGCFKGELVRACAEQGLDVTGIESLQAAIDSAGTMAQMRITRKGFLPEWPEADILILTGVYDLIVQEASSRPESCDAVQNFGSRLLNYEWILVWNEPSGRWDIRSHSSEDLNAILSVGHSRRHDLEDIAKQAVTQGLLHEIWQRGKDTSEIPQGLMVSHE